MIEIAYRQVAYLALPKKYWDFFSTVDDDGRGVYLTSLAKLNEQYALGLFYDEPYEGLIDDLLKHWAEVPFTGDLVFSKEAHA